MGRHCAPEIDPLTVQLRLPATPPPRGSLGPRATNLRRAGAAIAAAIAFGAITQGFDNKPDAATVAADAAWDAQVQGARYANELEAEGKNDMTVTAYCEMPEDYHGAYFPDFEDGCFREAMKMLDEG